MGLRSPRGGEGCYGGMLACAICPGLLFGTWELMRTLSICLLVHTSLSQFYMFRQLAAVVDPLLCMSRCGIIAVSLALASCMCFLYAGIWGRVGQAIILGVEPICQRHVLYSLPTA